MTRRIGRVTAALAALAGLLAACSTTTSTPDRPTAVELAGTHWEVTGCAGADGKVMGLVEGTHLTMDFGADGRVAGSAGCNRYSAAYTVAGASLQISQAVATRMACFKEGSMEQEQKFLDALATVAAARLD